MLINDEINDEDDSVILALAWVKLDRRNITSRLKKNQQRFKLCLEIII